MTEWAQIEFDRSGIVDERSGYGTSGFRPGFPLSISGQADKIYPAAVGSDSRTLEIDLEGGVEGGLKGLILCFTHWVLTSGASSSRSDPHKY
jgi:hypothetical protein